MHLQFYYSRFITSLSISTLLWLVITPVYTHTLKCYIGQQNASLPVYGEPQLCQPGSLTCTKTYDPSMNIAHRQCSMSNCTVNGILSTVSTCINSTTFPFSTYCCCYGEACNSAPRGAFVRWSQITASFLFIAASTFLVSINYRMI